MLVFQAVHGPAITIVSEEGMKFLLGLLAIVLCSFTRPAFAESTVYSDPLLDHLIGTWVLRGNIAHRPTTHDVVAEWVLGHEYVRLHEVSREKDAKGNPAYEAIVLIGSGRPSHDYACLWLDTTGGGGLAPEGIGHAIHAVGEIPFAFSDGTGKVSFRNTFVYHKNTHSWEWIMDNVLDGKLIPFGRVTLTRQ
jgi:hypothetical protein